MSTTSEQDQTNSPSEQTWLKDMRVKRVSPAPSARDAYQELKQRIQQRLLAQYRTELKAAPASEKRALLQQKLDLLLAEDKIVVKREERRRLVEAIFADIFGLGPLERLLNVEGVTEIMVNGPRDVFIARNGRIERVDVTFEDEAHLNRFARRITASEEHQSNHQATTVDARLPDGSYVSAILPPVSLQGTSLIIRRPVRRILSFEQLVKEGTLSLQTLEFLRACVQARFNILIAGNVGAGKTTLLSSMASTIPAAERIISIENLAELALENEHMVRLEARAAQTAGESTLSMQRLVQNALRMRPDRLLIGELRGAEAWDLLQAMNSGHAGCMATIYANSARDTLARLETVLLLADVHLPLPTLRMLIASTINLIVYVERLQDNSRRVLSISEVHGLEGDLINLTEIFRFEQMGVDEGKVIGSLQPTGVRPKSMWKIREAGVLLSPSVFSVSKR